MKKVCFHNHTYASRYALNTVEDFREALDNGVLDKLAITDHDNFNSAKEIQSALGEDKVILGQEITTTDGDIIGLFLKKFVPSGLTADRTCDLIHAQGSVVYIPHPFGKKGVGEEVLTEIKDKVDVVEIFNAWHHRTLATPFTSKKMNDRAEEWAKENNIPGLSASDCHYKTNIGRSFTELEDFSDAKEFLESIKGEVKYQKRYSKISLLSFRAFIKGFLHRDFLGFIR